MLFGEKRDLELYDRTDDNCPGEKMFQEGKYIRSSRRGSVAQINALDDLAEEPGSIPAEAYGSHL